MFCFCTLVTKKNYLTVVFHMGVFFFLSFSVGKWHFISLEKRKFKLCKLELEEIVHERDKFHHSLVCCDTACIIKS